MTFFSHDICQAKKLVTAKEQPKQIEDEDSKRRLEKIEKNITGMKASAVPITAWDWNMGTIIVGILPHFRPFSREPNLTWI